ncbi:MAG TPA: molybdate ABC transporter substrate-binding protein [Mycobacterium sp.]|nr:molybdate ABC transporter substrate-binding protein [Mycobacterium sp.]
MSLLGCSTPQHDSPTLTVFAAASLRSTFTELGATFEQQHPGTTVSFNFAGSSDLVAQLVQGAPGDVLASADTETMAAAVDAGLISGTPVEFAANTLTIVTAPGNPRHIRNFVDLTEAGTQVVVCAPQVPCGSVTEKVEQAAGIALSPVSEESAVTDVLGKVISGQADAGLVYVTDARAAGNKVDVVPFAESAGVVNTYPIAMLAGSRNQRAAAQFVELVTGPHGRKTFTAAGFVIR